MQSVAPQSGATRGRMPADQEFVAPFVDGSMSHRPGSALVYAVVAGFDWHRLSIVQHSSLRTAVRRLQD